MVLKTGSVEMIAVDFFTILTFFTFVLPVDYNSITLAAAHTPHRPETFSNTHTPTKHPADLLEQHVL